MFGANSEDNIHECAPFIRHLEALVLFTRFYESAQLNLEGGRYDGKRRVDCFYIAVKKLLCGFGTWNLIRVDSDININIVAIKIESCIRNMLHG